MVLKFLIPKLKIEDKDQDTLDQLMESIDLSTYGLERVKKLNESIKLDETETIVDPQNPNPRGAHGDSEKEEELEVIINSFNERWFQGWSSTPENQRVTLINLGKSIEAHQNFNQSSSK